MDTPDYGKPVPKIKRMPIAEFRDIGLLQEINRRFLHPMGLALEITVDESTGEMKLNGVWDCRNEPDGVSFAPGCGVNRAKAERVQALFNSRRANRWRTLGYHIQPLEEDDGQLSSETAGGDPDRRPSQGDVPPEQCGPT